MCADAWEDAVTPRVHLDLRELVSDEKGHLSTARVGLWVTMALAILTVGVDVALTVAAARAFIPNPVYALEGTMFTVFAGWAAGPRIAQYLLPQVGQIAQGIGASARPPHAGMDQDERGND